MNESKERGQVIEELQVIEQHLHNLLAQKQINLVEIQEINNALKELKATKDEVYKILSGIMLKSDKEILLRELEEKKRVIELRINSIEKQENMLEERAGKIKQKVLDGISKETKDKRET